MLIGDEPENGFGIHAARPFVGGFPVISRRAGSDHTSTRGILKTLRVHSALAP